MKGKIIEYKNNYGYIEGEDTKENIFVPEEKEEENEDEFEDYRVYEPRRTYERESYESDDAQTYSYEEREILAPELGKKSYPVYEEPKYEKVEEPVRVEREIVRENVVEEPIQKELEDQPKPSMPSVFSSVYVNRDKEEPVLKEINQVTEPKSVVKPVAPKMELPKMMDLPKRKD